MAKRKYLVFNAAAALVFATCVDNALVNNAKAANTAEKTAPAGPMVVALAKLAVNHLRKHWVIGCRTTICSMRHHRLFADIQCAYNAHNGG